MDTGERLRVRVNDDLVLAAGTCEDVSGPHGPERIVHPPATTLFHQVLAYGLAELTMITPSRWTLTETSREVRLPATA